MSFLDKLGRAVGTAARSARVEGAVAGEVVKGGWKNLTKTGDKAIDFMGIDIPVHKNKFLANTVGRRWKPGLGFAIAGTGLVAGAAGSGYQAQMSAELGSTAPDQMAGSIHDTRSPGLATQTVRPRWYDNDADGSLVFALDALRRG